jgi:hypothetical protein
VVFSGEGMPETGAAGMTDKSRPIPEILVHIMRLVAIATALAFSAPVSAQAGESMPPRFSGVWCYQKYESQDMGDNADVYRRGESIPDCANRGGFTIWTDGKGYTFGRFKVVRNSCTFEKVDLVASSEKGETYEARVACDNSGEDADDPENDEIEHINLIIQYDREGGEDRLILSNPPEG